MRYNNNNAESFDYWWYTLIVPGSWLWITYDYRNIHKTPYVILIIFMIIMDLCTNNY